MKNKTYASVILDALQNLEFVCGLKQIREYRKDDVTALVEGLTSYCKRIHWMTVNRLEIIFYKGMRGEYGQFYHINEMTLSTWIRQYFENNRNQIGKEISYMQKDSEISDDEKQYWIEKGKERFRDLFNKSRESGVMVSLDEFAPYWFERMQNKGLLDVSKYDVTDQIDLFRKHLRLAGKDYSESVLKAKSNDLVWKMFLQDCINKKIDLTEYI